MELETVLLMKSFTKMPSEDKLALKIDKKRLSQNATNMYPWSAEKARNLLYRDLKESWTLVSMSYFKLKKNLELKICCLKIMWINITCSYHRLLIT